MGSIPSNRIFFILEIITTSGSNNIVPTSDTGFFKKILSSILLGKKHII